MADYVTLMGAEDVARAGSAMRQAADDMNRAALSFDESLRRHQEFMDDWLFRFNDALVAFARNAGMA